MEMHAEQISPLLLLGVVGFVYLVGGSRPRGGACALLAIKPHLLLPFWPVLLLWTVYERPARPLGGLLAGAVAMAVPLAFDPAVLGQYRQSLAQRDAVPTLDPTGTITPTLRAAARGLWGRTSMAAIRAGRLCRGVAGRLLVHTAADVGLADGDAAARGRVRGCGPYAFVYDFVLLLAAVVPLAAWVCGHRDARDLGRGRTPGHWPRSAGPQPAACSRVHVRLAAGRSSIDVPVAHGDVLGAKAA
jgi:hypothetical protein